jgi:hypothetical protein
MQVGRPEGMPVIGAFSILLRQRLSWFRDSGRPAARIGCVGDSVLHFFLEILRVFNSSATSADFNRCVVTKQVGEQDIHILHLRLVSIWYGAVCVGV